jgi:hypothetical protein
MRTHIIRSLPLALFVALAALGLQLGTGTAEAGWGFDSECSQQVVPLHHCYAEEAWYETGYPTEYGVGAATKITPTSAPYVYEPEGGKGFLTQEEWVGFHGGTWIETGLMDGPDGCCRMHRFYQSWGSGKQLNEYISPEGQEKSVPQWSEIWAPEGAGYWGVWWGGVGNGQGTLMVADRGYPEYEDEIDVGTEVATTVRPYEWGEEEVGAVEPPYNEWVPLEDTVTHEGSKPFVGLGTHERLSSLCLAAFGTRGDTRWSTCQSQLEPPGVPDDAVVAAAPNALAAEPAPAGVSAADALQIALKYANANGVQPIEVSVAPKATFAHNHGILNDPTSTLPPETVKVLAQPSYLVVMTGNFTLNNVSVPSGDAAPTGKFLALTIDANTGFVEGVHLGPTAPSSPELEAVPSQIGANASVASTHGGRGKVVGGMFLAGTKLGEVVTEKTGGTITVSKSNTTVETVPVGPTGAFSLTLKPGVYLIRGRATNGSYCGVTTSPERVRVEARRTTHISLPCEP